MGESGVKFNDDYEKISGTDSGSLQDIFGKCFFCVCAGLQTNEDKMKAMVYITGFMWGLQVK